MSARLSARGAGSALIALALGVTPVVALMPGAWGAQPDSITICHATGATGNPYVTEHPAPDSKLVAGHGDHLGPIYADGMTSGWGDIIPPFSYTDKDGVLQSYAGLNWTTDGQAWLANNCAAPATGGGTGGTTGGDTGGTTGDTTGGTTGDTTGGTTGDTTGGTTGDTTGGQGGGGVTTGTTGGDTFTGGGGGSTTTVTRTVTRGGGTATVAKTLPFTGRNTGNLVLGGLASLVAGVGLVVAGSRRPAAR